MKRSFEGHPNVVNWKYCFICQFDDEAGLRRTEIGSDKLAERLRIFWDLGGSFEFDINQVATFENDQPNFQRSFDTNNAKYHHDCASKYSKQKIDRLRKKNEKAKLNTPSTRSSHGERKLSSYFCAICQEKDESSNLHAAGLLHATHKDVNRSHHQKLTERWKNMAVKVGNDFLISLLASGDLKSNEIFLSPCML